MVDNCNYTIMKEKACFSIEYHSKVGSVFCQIKYFLSDMSNTLSSHATHTSRSKEKTDNTPTDKTEQVTFGKKQHLSFRIVIF